ncbi:MAG: UbiA family prenyltransferase [Bacteroidales bacterium]|nr:UbiA family prenyltransferase [Bacteroidales bacterium]
MTKNKNSHIKNYLSLVKFSHTVFAMPFALIGFFIAVKLNGYEFSWKLLGLIILCMVFARNAAMAFNRYVDREIDFKNPRTTLREIPAGIIKAKSALFFVIINSILFITTTFFINKLTFYLSHLALFIVLGYSITKKFTSLCHLILGLGLSLAPIGAYLSVTGEFNWLPVLFSLIVIFWVSGFDIIYALQDKEFDIAENLKSMPVWLGKKKALITSILFHLISSSFVILIGILYPFGLWYWIGTIFFLGFLIYQHLIIKPNDLSKVNIAFFATNGIASIIFAFFVISDLYI